MNLYEYIAEGEIQMFEVKDLSMIYDMNTDSKTYALKGIDQIGRASCRERV